MTAAHCIQRFGSGGSVFSGWVFTPGHYGPSGATTAQIQPYGMWNWRALVRPASWANGTDIGSGSARDNDLAVIALAKNDQNQFIGDLVGHLGYGWNNYSFVFRFRQNSRYPNAAYGIYGAGNIASLLLTLCSSPAGGGQTYAQAGYCD